MKSIGGKEIVELVGISAIVASLIFVGYQIKQDRMIARSELGSETATLLVEIHDAMSNPEWSEVYAKMLDRPGDLSVDEMLQINHRLEAISQIFFRECYLLTRGVFDGCDTVIRTHLPIFFGNRYAQIWWQESMMKPLLPSWVDEEIAKLDPDTEMHRIEAIKREL
jgi:hypothetical protein